MTNGDPENPLGPYIGPAARTVTVMYMDSGGSYGLRTVTNVLTPANLTTEDCGIPESSSLICALEGEAMLYWLTSSGRGALPGPAMPDQEPEDDDFAPTPEPIEGENT